MHTGQFAKRNLEGRIERVVCPFYYHQRDVPDMPHAIRGDHTEAGVPLIFHVSPLHTVSFIKVVKCYRLSNTMVCN